MQEKEDEKVAILLFDYTIIDETGIFAPPYFLDSVLESAALM
jgi:hypothetical protein